METSTTSARFKIINYEDADEKVREIYEDTMKTFQLPFVLNWFKCQGSNGILLAGNWSKLKSTLVEGKVPNILKQLIIYNVSRERGCDYCTKAHGAFADSMSSMISDKEGFKVTENMDSPLIPESYRKAIRIVSMAALHPQKVEDRHFQELKECGFDKAETQELMAQADLVNMLNTIADISGIRIDNELLEAEE